MILDRHCVSSYRKGELATVVSDRCGLERKGTVVLSSEADSPLVVFRHRKVVDIIPVRTLGYSNNRVTLKCQLGSDHSTHVTYPEADDLFRGFGDYSRHIKRLLSRPSGTVPSWRVCVLSGFLQP